MIFVCVPVLHDEFTMLGLSLEVDFGEVLSRENKTLPVMSVDISKDSIILMKHTIMYNAQKALS